MPNTLIWIPKRLVELGLVNVAARSPEAFIDYCEQDYAARVEHAAACVRESGAHVVMLTGPSASGKTTTAHKLADCIAAHGRRSAVVSLDNFYKDLKDYPRLPDGSVDYESVDALDISAINRCLLELIRTGRTQIPDFDFCGERRRHGVIPVEVGDGVVVIEGIHALNPRLTALLPEGSAFKIYAGMREEYSRDGQRILPTRDVRLARRMVRDHKFRGHSLEKTFSMWPAVCEGEDKNIKVFKPEADLLLDTSFSYEVCWRGRHAGGRGRKDNRRPGPEGQKADGPAGAGKQAEPRPAPAWRSGVCAAQKRRGKHGAGRALHRDHRGCRKGYRGAGACASSRHGRRCTDGCLLPPVRRGGRPTCHILSWVRGQTVTGRKCALR